jgi:hypothetical protein
MTHSPWLDVLRCHLGALPYWKGRRFKSKFQAAWEVQTRQISSASSQQSARHVQMGFVALLEYLCHVRDLE